MSSFLGGGGGGGGNKPPAVGSTIYYVATTGSDSNPGTLAQPFATIAHGLHVAAQFDYLGLFIPTVQVEDGAYDVSTNNPTADLPLILNPLDPAKLFGNISTPANVVITNSGGDTPISCSTPGANWHVEGFRLDPIGFTSAMACAQFSNLEFDNIEFANSAADGVFTCIGCTVYSSVVWDGTYLAVIASAFNRFIFMHTFASVDLRFGVAFNFPVATAVGQQFINMTQYSTLLFSGNTFTNFGGVTGNRLNAIQGAVLRTDNGLVTDIPGSATGTIDATVEWISKTSTFTSFFNNSKAGFPTASNASPGFYGVFKDTTDGPRLLTINDGGVIYSVQIGVNINVQTASYTLQLFDQGGIVEMNVAGANTLTIPLNASVAFPIGTQVMVTQAGAGATTVAGAGGVTVHNAGTLSAQWAVTRLYKRATDEWVMGL